MLKALHTLFSGHWTYIHQCLLTTPLRSYTPLPHLLREYTYWLPSHLLRQYTYWLAFLPLEGVYVLAAFSSLGRVYILAAFLNGSILPKWFRRLRCKSLQCNTTFIMWFIPFLKKSNLNFVPSIFHHCSQYTATPLIRFMWPILRFGVTLLFIEILI